jgi:hypothetical protein
LQLVLFALSHLVPAEAVSKVLWLAVLLVASLTSYRAVPSQKFVPRAAAATLYLFNPFVYDRLQYGQVFLLAAYAVLPWVAVRFRLLAESPGRRTALTAGMGLVLVGAFSVHLLVVASLFGAVMLVGSLATARNRAYPFARTVRWWGVAALAAIVGTAYWWIPMAAGAGYEARVIAATASREIRTYAAVPDSSLGLLPNLLALYGFWAESSSRFTSMKTFVPGWPIALSLILLIGGLGAVTAMKRRTNGSRPWAIALVAAGAIGLVLEMGISSPLTALLVDWLDAHLVVYRGMRDSAKWGALLALVYSQLFGLGTAAALDGVRRWRVPSPRVESVAALIGGVLIALPIYYGNGLLYGMHGEIKPSHYPAGWYAADRLLLSDPNPGRAIFLPWHEYQGLSFVQNQNPVIASPARTFFSIPVVVSTDPEVSRIKPYGPDQAAVSELVRARSTSYWAQVLADRGIKYVLLAKEVDWRSYEYLNSQRDLVQVADFGSIIVYRNELLR